MTIPVSDISPVTTFNRALSKPFWIVYNATLGKVVGIGYIIDPVFLVKYNDDFTEEYYYRESAESAELGYSFDKGSLDIIETYKREVMDGIVCINKYKDGSLVQINQSTVNNPQILTPEMLSMINFIPFAETGISVFSIATKPSGLIFEMNVHCDIVTLINIFPEVALI